MLFEVDLYWFARLRYNLAVSSECCWFFVWCWFCFVCLIGFWVFVVTFVCVCLFRLRLWLWFVLVVLLCVVVVYWLTDGFVGCLLLVFGWFLMFYVCLLWFGWCIDDCLWIMVLITFYLALCLFWLYLYVVFVTRFVLRLVFCVCLFWLIVGLSIVGVVVYGGWLFFVVFGLLFCLIFVYLGFSLFVSLVFVVVLFSCAVW